MKKVLLGLAVVILALTGCSKSNKLHVKMEIKKEIGDTIVVFSTADRDNQQKFVGKDGVFEFDVELKEPTMLMLVEPQLFMGQQGAMYQIPGVPGEEVLLTDVDGIRYDVTGSKFYSQFHEADLSLRRLVRRRTSSCRSCRICSRLVLHRTLSLSFIRKVWSHC